MFDITGKRTLFLIISEVIILIGIVALVVFGLKPGIEFSSGSIMTVSFEDEVAQSELQEEMANLGYDNVIIQRTGEGDYIIRTPELSGEEKTALEDGLSARFGSLTEREFYSVSAMVAGETTRNAAIAVGVAAVGIMLYITWAFRRMPKPFHYGICAIIALAHDVVVVLGIFSILGAIMNWEINLMFITGVLAVIGYSINNTVVVFDRIRENLRRGISHDFEVVVNSSLVETLSRSLNTSLTTMFVVLALLLFVGASIQNFAVVLLIGIAAGTYSSLYIAPALLIVWERGEWGRLVFSRRAKAKGA
jgi:preprotein translocase subunit SecF